MSIIGFFLTTYFSLVLILSMVLMALAGIAFLFWLFEDRGDD